MNYIKEKEDLICEQYYDEFRTPFWDDEHYKYDRWCINANDECSFFTLKEWCVSIFDSDLRNNNKVYHIQRWGEPFDVVVDIKTGDIISYKGSCDIKKIRFLNTVWRQSDRNGYKRVYNDILDNIWQGFKTIMEN